MNARTRAIAAGISLVLLVGTAVSTPVAGESLVAAGRAVAIPSDGYDITGTFVLPIDDGGAVPTRTVPAVLMLHGYGSSADEVGGMYARLAEALAAQGIGSLRIDFAGMGGSQASTLDYTWDSQVSDAEVALDWLTAQDQVDGERVGVQGFSLGSMIAAHLVGTDPRPVAFGSWSGAIYNGGEGWYVPSIEECEATGEGHLELDLGWRTLDHSCEFFTSMTASTALDDFAAYAGPLLLIAGTDDTSVDPAVSGEAATVSASEDVTLELIPGADHIYLVLTEDQTLADEVIDRTADWFVKML